MVVVTSEAAIAAPASEKSCVASSTNIAMVIGPPTTATAKAAMPTSAAFCGSTTGAPIIRPIRSA